MRSVSVRGRCVAKYFFFILIIFFSVMTLTESAERNQRESPPKKEISSLEKDINLIETDIEVDQIIPELEGNEDAVKSAAKTSLQSPADKNEGIPLREEQVIELNKTLKNVIEENEKLQKEKQRLDDELRSLRGQRQIEINRINAMTEEMRRIRAQTEGIVDLNQKYSRQLVDLQVTMKDKEQQYQLKIKELEDRVPQEDSNAAQNQLVYEKIDADGEETQENIVAMVDQFNKESERLKQDTAKVHYNMGNIYFHNGEYEKAAGEYKKVLNLMPSDAAAHFNLAFVSGEFLGEPEVALRHYKEYVFLIPEAADRDMVEEKILQMELKVRTKINSPLDSKKFDQRF